MAGLSDGGPDRSPGQAVGEGEAPAGGRSGEGKALRRHDNEDHKTVTLHSHKTGRRTGLGFHGYFWCLL